MDIPYHVRDSAVAMIRTIEMHTSQSMGRIIYAGFPEIDTSLSQAQQHGARGHHIARVHHALLNRPTLEDAAFCAILQPNTQLVGPGTEQAHMGFCMVLGESLKSFEFGALAVSRFLVDNHQNSTIFPRGHLLDIQQDFTVPDKGEVELRLHSPFGILHVVVPTTRDAFFGAWVTDASRDIRFSGPPLFAQDLFLEIKIPAEHRWPALIDLGSESIIVGVAFIGRHVIIVSPHQLGFSSSDQEDFAAIEDAKAKAFLAIDNDTIVQNWAKQAYPLSSAAAQPIAKFFANTEKRQRGSITEWVERGVYSTPLDQGDNQIEGYVRVSVVEARLALAVAQGEARPGETWFFPRAAEHEDYDLSAKVTAGRRGFEGSCTVEISGRTHYVGAGTFLIAADDKIRADMAPGGS